MTIVESNTIACGASGKAGGYLAKDWSDHSPLGPLSRKSFQLHHELARTLPSEEYGFRTVDTLSVSMASRRSKKTTLKLPEWMNGEHVSGSQILGTQATGCQVHPEHFTKTILKAAQETGHTQVVYAAVKHIDAAKTQVKLSTGETLEADHIVIAMGPWTALAQQWLPQIPDITTQRAHSIVLQPEGDLLSGHVIFAEGNRTGPDPEIVPRPDGTVYVCGCTDDAPLPQCSTQVVCRQEYQSQLHKTTGLLSKRLGEAECVKLQACYLPYTPDGLPVMGKLGDTISIATGHSCWGILNAPATGLVMSELIVDGQMQSLDGTPFSPSRFSSVCN